jgi:hypothetical protein
MTGGTLAACIVGAEYVGVSKVDPGMGVGDVFREWWRHPRDDPGDRHLLEGGKRRHQDDDRAWSVSGPAATPNGQQALRLAERNANRWRKQPYVDTIEVLDVI